MTLPATASQPGPVADRQPVLPSILLMLLAVVLFSFSDVMAKVLREAMPAVEVAWMRYVVFTAMGVGLAARSRFAALSPRRPWLQVFRGLALLGSALFFITGLSHLQIAEATAIGFVSPAFITALSIPVLGEVVGIRRWAAVLVGLLGVLIVIRPGAGALQGGAAYPLASALCWAAAVVITRKMGATDRTETTLLWSAGTGLAVLTLLVPFDFVTPTAGQIAIALGLGVLSSAGQYLIIIAYRRALASVLAPFSYAQILSSTAVGFLVFGTVPDAVTFIGAGVIILSGLYTAQRERIRARERAAKAG